MDVTRVGLERLLSALNGDRERAGEDYNRLHAKLIMFFRARGHGAPDEAADETLDRVAARLIAGELVRDVMRYSLGVGRLVALEERRAQSREQRALLDYEFVRSATEPADPQWYELLARCLARMTSQERWLLAAYYENLTFAERRRRRAELAARLNISLDQLRVRIHRLRFKLEANLRSTARERGRKSTSPVRAD